MSKNNNSNIKNELSGIPKEIRKEKKYINLNVHSNFTAYETVMTPEEIVEYAVWDGASAVALTDKNSVGGFMRFSRAADKYKDEGFKPIYGVQINCLIEKDSPTLITLLAKNQTGLRNMYKIITAGYMTPKETDSWPCVSKQDVENNRKGLLVGMELQWEKICEADSSELEEEFRFADYVGIRPWSERPSAHNDGRTIDEEQLREAAARMIRLLNELGKCPVAVSGANAITKEDELCFDILRAVLSPAQEADFAFMKSTAEVLEDYQFLGRALAEKIVIENTNIINESISDDIIVGGGDITLIDIPDAMCTVENQCNEAMREKYGSSPPEIIRQRLDQELDLIRKAGNFASYYVLASKITNKCDEMGQPHSLRGCGGGSLVANLMGITETNPLPPHYHCRTCGRVELADGTQVSSGFDLNNGKGERVCPDCGNIMTGEGQDIPCEFFLGYEGDKTPDFDINIPGEIRQVIVSCLEGVFGNDKIYNAGTVSTIFYCHIAVEAVNRFCSERDYDLSHERREKLSQRIRNVVWEEGKHTGCHVIVPRDREIYDFCPLGYSQRKELMEGEKPATRIDFHELPLETIHVLNNGMLSQLKQMEQHSGILLKDTDIEQIDIARFFESECYVGLPFVTQYVKTMLEIIRPATYTDLLKIYGFACGTGVWIDNAKELLERGYDLSDTIAFREDVMQYLVKKGVDHKDAFAIAEKVRIGRAQRQGFASYESNIFEEHNVPSWYIRSMKKIGYLFPKSHAVEYMNIFLKMVWYKLYHPAAFYAAVNG